MKLLLRRVLPLLVLLAALLLTACGGDEPTPTPTEEVAVEPSPTTAPTEVPATPLPEPTDTPLPEPTATPPPAPTETPPPTSAGAPIFEAADCEFDAPPGYDIDCGWVELPENRSAPDNGRTVRLHVAIFHSASDSPAPDPIVYLEGGPGGDALEAVPLVFETRFSPFIADRDFIMYDQRGTGYSEPSLACDEISDLVYETIEMALSPIAAFTLQQEALDACRDRLLADGVDLTAYNSAESAADLRDLRLALGYEEWNLFGISYGTRLALTTMRDYPQGIRSVVLDSVYPPEVNLQTDTVANAARAFNVLFDNCAADEICNSAYPDLRTVFNDTVNALNDEPVFVPVIDVFSRETYDAYTDGTALQGALFQSLYSAELLPLLPQMIYQVADGNYATLGLLLSNSLANLNFVSTGMQLSVQCHEELAFSSPGEAETAAAEYPELADFFRYSSVAGEAAIEICDAWGAGSADALENEPVVSDLPVFVLAGEYDPITPPSWAEQVAANLPNSVYVEFPATGHGASVSGECQTAMTLAFINEPTGPLDDSCVAEISPIAFAVAGSAAAVELVPFSDPAFGITTVVPDGWENAGPGTYVRGASALDQTILLQVLVPGGSGSLILGQLATNLGIDGWDASDTAYVDGQGREWSLYSASGLGQSYNLGVIDDGTTTLVVLLVSEVAEEEVLLESVFFPVMDAISPN